MGHNNLKGALLLSLAAMVFTAEVVLIRFAADEAATAQIVFFRALAQLVLGTLMVLGSGGTFGTRRPGLQIARGLTSLALWLLYYISFILLDLALATTLTFSTSLFVVLLAGPVLGERIGLSRWVATIVGFAGIIVATGVSPDSLNFGVAVGLTGAVLAAALVLLNRVLVRTEQTATIMFYIGIVTLLGSIPVAMVAWQPLSAPTLALLVLAGMVGATGMWLTIEAYRVGEVSALAPFPYLRMVFAVIAGLLIFSEIPPWNSLVGMVIIVAATIYVARVERRRGLAAPHR